MTRKEVFIFAAGVLLGGAGGYFSSLQAPRFVYHLHTDQPPTLELAAPEPIPTDATLTFQDEDVRTALQRLSRAAGLKVLLSDHVQGSITLIIDDPDTTPRRAIDLIVGAQGLVIDEANGTLYIKSADEWAKEPTNPGQYTFKNARSAEAKLVLAKRLRSGIEPVVDERTNTIFYTENHSNVPAIEELLHFLDQPLQPHQ